MKFKHIIISAAAMLISVCASAQISAADYTITKGEIDSTSYLIGVNFGSFIKGNNFKGLDRDVVRSGLGDFLGTKGDPTSEEFISSLRYNPYEMNETLNAFIVDEPHPDSLVTKASYMIGIYFGSFIVGNGFPEPNFKRMDDGIDAFLKAEGDPDGEEFGKQFEIDPMLMNELFPRILMKQEIAAMQENLEESESFLRLKKTQLNLSETESGLLYKIISSGDTSRKPTPDNKVTVLYKGTRMDGSVFDEHMDPENPMSFVLARVIDGWTEGLQLIGEGGKIMLYVHPDLAYGERGAGSDIAPNSALVFEVTLLKVEY